MAHADVLAAKLADKTAEVVVVGLGYAGLSLAAALARAGLHRAFDDELIAREARVVVDARNALHGVSNGSARVVRL